MTNKITSEAGNPIKEAPSGAQYIFVGNDGYEMDDAGKFTIQVFADGQWNEIENGRCDDENEASECVNDLIRDEIYAAENIRYSQI